MINKKNNDYSIRKNNDELKNAMSLLFHIADNNIANHEEEKSYNKLNKAALLEEKKKLAAIQKADEVAQIILNLVHNTFTTADSKEGKIEDPDGLLGSFLEYGACGYISKTSYVFNENGLTINIDYSTIDYNDNCVYCQSILGSPNSDSINLEHLNQKLSEYGISIERTISKMALQDGDSVDVDILTIFVPRTRVKEQDSSSRQ